MKKNLFLVVLLTAAYTFKGNAQTSQVAYNSPSYKVGNQDAISLYSWWGNITGSKNTNTKYATVLTEGDNYLYTGSGADFFEVEIYSDGPQGVFTGAYWEFLSGDYSMAISQGQSWLHLDARYGSEAEYNFHYTDDTGDHILHFHFIITGANPPDLL